MNDVQENKDTYIRANAIRSIRMSCSDFIGSRFDVNIVVSSKNRYEDAFRKIISELGIDLELNSFGMLSRIEGITIPQLKAKSFSLRTSNDLVQKVSSSIDGSNKSSLKIRADEMCYIYDIFNLISNNNELSSNGGRAIKKFSAFSTLRMADNLKNRTTIDIVVRNSCLEQYCSNRKFYGSDPVDKDDIVILEAEHELKQKDKCLWLFSDVNFLGFQNGLSFSHSSGENQILNLDFIFKRLVRIDPKLEYKSSKEETDKFFEKFETLEDKKFYETNEIPNLPSSETQKENFLDSIYGDEEIKPFIPVDLDLSLTNNDFLAHSLYGTRTGLGKDFYYPKSENT